MADQTPGLPLNTEVLLDSVGTGTVTSEKTLDIGAGDAVCIEVFTGGTSPSGKITVLDSALPAGVFTATIDTANGKANQSATITSNTKFNVTGTRRFVKVQLISTAGIFTVIASAVHVPVNNQASVIGSVAQGTAAAASGSWPVEVTDGTNVLGTAGHPLAVNNQGPTQAISLQPVNIAASGDSTVIAASVGKKIHIVHYHLQNTSSADTTVILKDGATALNGLGTLLHPSMGDTFDAPGGIGNGEIIGTAGNAFVINLSAANQLSGYILYYQV